MNRFATSVLLLSSFLMTSCGIHDRFQTWVEEEVIPHQGGLDGVELFFPELDTYLEPIVEAYSEELRTGVAFVVEEEFAASQGSRDYVRRARDFYSTPTRGTSLGGVPYLTSKSAWPRSQFDGKPLSFVAQVARDEVNAPYMGDIQLIQIFFDYRNYLNWETSYNENVVILVTKVGEELPSYAPSLDDVVQLQEDASQLDTTYDAIIDEHIALDSMAIETITTDYVDDESRFTDWYDVVKDEYEYDEYFYENFFWEVDEFIERRYPDVIRDTRDTFMMRGTPFFIQEGTPSLTVDGKELPFFLQIPSVNHYMFGDSGMLYLYLDPEDIYDATGQMQIEVDVQFY